MAQRSTSSSHETRTTQPKAVRTETHLRIHPAPVTERLIDALYMDDDDFLPTYADLLYRRSNDDWRDDADYDA